MKFCAWAPRHEGVINTRGVALALRIIIKLGFLLFGVELYALASLIPLEGPSVLV
jgi:hypothetical protein